MDKHVIQELAASRIASALAPRLADIQNRIDVLNAQRAALASQPAEPPAQQVAAEPPAPTSQEWSPSADEMFKMIQAGRQSELLARLAAMERD